MTSGLAKSGRNPGFCSSKICKRKGIMHDIDIAWMKKMYCVQQQTITCPLNRNKTADTAISKANIADTKAFYGFK
jgi:hypothetical protein